MPLVTFEEHGQLGEIVISNPPQNRFTVAAITDLSDAVKAAAASGARAVLLRAEGDDFPAGADPAIFDGIGAAAAGQLAAAVIAGTHAWEGIQVPTIALIQGRCFDGAFEQCLACDLIWAAEGARISQIETAAGGFPWAGATQRLASRIGAARAAEMVLTAAVVPAETLHAWGAINRVTPPGQLLGEGRAFAQTLADGPTPAYKAIKRVLHAWRSGGVAEADRVGVAEAPAVMLSQDFRDGVESLKQHGLGHATFHGR
jgi:enoyl-CoA hydratase